MEISWRASGRYQSPANLDDRATASGWIVASNATGHVAVWFAGTAVVVAIAIAELARIAMKSAPAQAPAA